MGKETKILVFLSKCKFTLASVFLSFICFCAILNVNYDISLRYGSSSGKTQALFGLVEILEFHYRYYYLGFGLIAFVFAIIAFHRKEERIGTVLVSILSILSIISTFIPYWKLTL